MTRTEAQTKTCELKSIEDDGVKSENDRQWQLYDKT